MISFRQFFRGATKNITYKFLAVLIALLLWFASVKNRVVTEYIEMPLSFSGLSENLVISDFEPDTIAFQAHARGGELMELKRRDLTYGVNLKGYEKGVYELDVEKKNITGTDNMSVFEAIGVSTIKISIEQKDEKTVPVFAVYSGDTPPGYKLLEPIEVKPSFVSIRGPKSVVRIDTFPVDITGMTTSFKKEITMDIPENTTLLGTKSKKVFASINIVRLKTVELRDVPIRIKGDYSLVFPRVAYLKLEVPVSVKPDELKQDISVSIDLTEYSRGSHNIIPVVAHPSWVNLLDLNPSSIQVIIE